MYCRFICNADRGLFCTSIYRQYSRNRTCIEKLIFYNYNLKTERTRIHFRFNYHFTKDENFDGYLGIGAGTNSRKNSYTSNDPYVTNEFDDTELLPFSVRVCLGGRYFFNENYGLVGEIGLGGALLRGGLSIKF